MTDSTRGRLGGVLLLAVVFLFSLSFSLVGAAQSSPTADCSLSESQIEPGEEVTLDASGSTGGDTYEYNRGEDNEGTAGDYDTDILSQDTHTFFYELAGEYEPAVRVWNTPNETTDAASCGSLTVTDNNPPEAGFDHEPGNPQVGQQVEFDSSSSDPNGGIIEYSWEIDGETVGSGPTLEHVFEERGEHQVALTVTDGDGATDTATKSIGVSLENEPPNPGFTVSPEEPSAGEQVTFTSDTTDPDGLISLYEWRIDGELVSEQESFAHSFDGPGDYVVELTVEDGDEARTSTNRTITVTEASNRAPSPDFSFSPRQPSVGESVEFTANASDPDGSVVGYEWMVDGDVVSEGESPTFSHAFGSAGEHMVSLRVTDDEGTSASVARTVVVAGENRPPDAEFSYSPENPTVDGEIVFRSTGSDPDGSVTAYEWRVDGEAVSTSITHSQAFESAGEHMVSLRVTDDDGATDTATRRITVSARENRSRDNQSRRSLDSDLTRRDLVVESPFGGDSLAAIRDNIRLGLLGSAREIPAMPSVAPDRLGSFETEDHSTYTIRFHSGNFTATPGLDPSLRDGEGTVWALVVFNHDSPDKERDTLESLGYKYRETVETNSHLAGIPSENLEEVQELGFVHSIHRIKPEWKRDPDFVRELERRGSMEVQVLSLTRLDEPGLTREADRYYTGEISRGELQELVRNEGVWWVQRRYRMKPQVAQGRRIVNAYTPRQARALPVDRLGGGVRVAVVDSGIRPGHRHFSSTLIKNATDWADGGAPVGEGGCVHGTHVAGTVLGSGRDFSQGLTVRGVAPGADLVVSRIFDNTSSGDCTTSQYSDLTKVFNDVEGENSDIISNSWGADTSGEYKVGARKTDKWIRDNRDVLVVFANGNNNRSVPNQNVNSPGLAKNPLTVGAIRDGSRWNGTVDNDSIHMMEDDSYLNTLDPPDDVLFGGKKGRKTYQGSGRVVPDVMAPGHWTTSSVQNGAYDEKLGTSMATPHVSGVAALYLQAQRMQFNRKITANEMKAALIATTKPVTGQPVGVGIGSYGIVDAQNAIGKNKFEHMQSHSRSVIKQGQSHSGTFNVPEGSERVVVTLAWNDPKGTPLRKGKVMRNNLSLHVGPASDPMRYTDTMQPTNVKKIVVHDPPSPPSQWRWTVRGHDVGVFPKRTQKYDVVTRVVADPPRINTPNFRQVDVPLRGQGNFNVSIDGTGAPTAVNYFAESDSALKPCSGTDNFGIVGTLHKGESVNASLCFESDVIGKHDAKLYVNNRGRGNYRYHEVELEVDVTESVPPEAVPNVRSPSHKLNKDPTNHSNNEDVEFEWDQATDKGPSGHRASGIRGYYVELDRSPNTNPSPSATSRGLWVGGRLGHTFGSMGSGEYYFHIKAEDEDGNKGPVIHKGPYYVDVTPPEDANRIDFEEAFHYRDIRSTRFGYTNKSNVTVKWSGVTDNRSRLASYNATVVESGCNSGCVVETVNQSAGDADAELRLQPDSYEFLLRAKDKPGNLGLVGKIGISIDQSDPTAIFEVSPSEPETGDTVTFNASRTWDRGGSGIYEYRWSFGDGNTTVTEKPRVFHSYSDNVTHNVTLTVVDNAGNRDSANESIDVAEATPGFGFAAAVAAILTLAYLGVRRRRLGGDDL